MLSTADLLNAELQLSDRNVDDQRDGYIELLPYRQTFENVHRKLLYNATQVTPPPRDAGVQTALSVPMNCWTQYLYEYQSTDISRFNEDERESLRRFLRRFIDEVCDEVSFATARSRTGLRAHLTARLPCFRRSSLELQTLRTPKRSVHRDFVTLHFRLILPRRIGWRWAKNYLK